MPISLRVAASFAAAVLLAPLSANADSISTYGDVALVATANGPAWQITSDPNGTGYGGLYVTVSNPAALTVADLTHLSAMYQTTQGAFGGGAPRFTLFDSSHPGGAYIYWGDPLGGGSFSDANGGAYGDTGNYADLSTSDLRVAVNGFGGISHPNTYESWSDFVAEAGGVQVYYIFLDVDGGFGGVQQVDVTSFTVNGTSYMAAAAAPEPASLALLGAGLAGLGALRRRAKRA